LLDQWNLASEITYAMSVSYTTYNNYAALQSAIHERKSASTGKDQAKALAESLQSLEKSAMNIAEGSDDTPGIGPINRDLSRYLVMIESADLRPAASAHQAVQKACYALQTNLHAWQKLNSEDVSAVSKLLESVPLPALPVAPKGPELTCSP